MENPVLAGEDIAVAYLVVVTLLVASMASPVQLVILLQFCYEAYLQFSVSYFLNYGINQLTENTKFSFRDHYCIVPHHSTV